MRNQQGVTILGAIIGIIVLVSGAVFSMQVVPVYVKDYQVKSAISALKTLDTTLFSEDAMTNADVLKKRLVAQLDVNSVTDLKDEQITVTPGEQGVYVVKVAYQVTRPLFFNISLLFDFNDSEEVHVGPK